MDTRRILKSRSQDRSHFERKCYRGLTTDVAFSSEVASGSREENASDRKAAFSSEVASGSREENASDKKAAFSSEVGRRFA